MPPELIEALIRLMSPRQFENLVFALVQLTDEDVEFRQLTPPDAGRDIIKPAAGAKRERAWQVKHCTSGINWGDCEESLDTAVRQRDPELVTFVLAADITEGKEAGLSALQHKYPRKKVVVAEPWTMAVVREKVGGNENIQKRHLWPLLGNLPAQQIEDQLRRIAAWRELIDAQVSAAIAGPLAGLGLFEESERVEEALKDDRPHDAVATLRLLADTAQKQFPAAADALRLRAAKIAADHHDKATAAALYLQASAGAAERGEPDAAEFAAFRAGWLLPPSETWQADTAAARAVWAERPDEAAPSLADATWKAIAHGADDDVYAWGGPAVRASICAGDLHGARALIAGISQRLGPTIATLARLDLELERIGVEADAGEDVADRLDELSNRSFPLASEAAAGRIEARRGVIAARAGNCPSAKQAFTSAAKHWRAELGTEDEVSESVFSAHTAATLLNESPGDDHLQRIAATDLRGSLNTDSVIAGRRREAGLQAWLEGRAWDARRMLTLAWDLHRRSGHLTSTLICARELTRIFAEIEEHALQLRWAIRSHDAEAARAAAVAVGWTAASDLVSFSGAPWEQIVVCEIISVVGCEASDQEAAQLAIPLLKLGASLDEVDGWSGPRRAPAARRALATLLCALPEQLREKAIKLVDDELLTTPYPPRVALAGLVHATHAGVLDRAVEVAGVLGTFDHMHVGSIHTGTLVIAASESARAKVADLAIAGHQPALCLAARLELPSECEQLADLCAKRVEEQLAGTFDPSNSVRRDDLGRLARWGHSADQELVLRRLSAELINSESLSAHRFEAAQGIVGIAPGLSPHLAASGMDLLVNADKQISQTSEETVMSSSANARLSRWVFHAPDNTPAVRASALQALVALAEVAGRKDDRAALVNEALDDDAAEVRQTALDLAARIPDLATDEQVLTAIGDCSDAVSRVAALAAIERGQIGSGHNLVARLLSDGTDARYALLELIANQADQWTSELTALSSDPDSRIRARARRALTASE